MLPSAVRLIEVGPREGFQFEGIGQPDRISTPQKLRLIEALAGTGLSDIQIVSFVSRRAMPQMADAEEICAALPEDSEITWTGIYLSDSGLRRALDVNRLSIAGELTVSASEPFSIRNQKRDFEQDVAAQEAIAAVYTAQGIRVNQANIMAAFGCNFAGQIPQSVVIERLQALDRVASVEGGRLERIMLADTMGWASPEAVRTLIGKVRDHWPDAIIRLHLHDTRGLAVANVYAGLLEGVTEFETAVGGLGGCPFAGARGAAGNVATEEVVFLCDQLGIETGVSLPALLEVCGVAEEIVGHTLASKLALTRPRQEPSG